MAFSANGTTRGIISGTQVRIEKPLTQSKDVPNQTKEVWAKAKDYAHDRLWFGYVLPALLQSEGVDTRGLSISQLISEMQQIWNTKQHMTKPQISVVMTFTHDDLLLVDYEGDIPTRYCKETNTRIPVQLNALASIGSNDFRWWVMQDDDEHDAVIPGDVFFGTYPIKYKGEIMKGQFRCILKPKV